MLCCEWSEKGSDKTYNSLYLLLLKFNLQKFIKCTRYAKRYNKIKCVLRKDWNRSLFRFHFYVHKNTINKLLNDIFLYTNFSLFPLETTIWKVYSTNILTHLTATWISSGRKISNDCKPFLFEKEIKLKCPAAENRYTDDKIVRVLPSIFLSNFPSSRGRNKESYANSINSIHRISIPFDTSRIFKRNT